MPSSCSTTRRCARRIWASKAGNRTTSRAGGRSDGRRGAVVRHRPFGWRAPRRIGLHRFATPALDTALWLIAILAGVLELGSVERQDFVAHARHASGDTQAFPGLSAELIASRPDRPDSHARRRSSCSNPPTPKRCLSAPPLPVPTLEGAEPGTPAIEQPTRFEFVVNKNTAKVIGLRLPASMRVQVDRLIEWRGRLAPLVGPCASSLASQRFSLCTAAPQQGRRRAASVNPPSRPTA